MKSKEEVCKGGDVGGVCRGMQPSQEAFPFFPPSHAVSLFLLLLFLPFFLSLAPSLRSNTLHTTKCVMGQRRNSQTSSQYPEQCLMHVILSTCH